MFHGGCREVSKVLSMGLEPISMSAVHYLAKNVSSMDVLVDKGPWYRWAFESIGMRGSV